MIVSIMQPYFFPYIGYFQLMAASDVFVSHDTVQYIKGGWVNRNRVLDGKGEAAWLTLPVAAANHQLDIRRRAYVLAEGERLLRRIENAYRNAPHFETAFPVIRDIVQTPEPNVAAFNMRLLRAIAERLGLKTRLVSASDLPTSDLTGEARVIELCKALEATHYVNPMGGSELYDAEHFRANGISLGFLETQVEPREGQHPYLSIIHVLMTESAESIADLLSRYRIVER